MDKLINLLLRSTFARLLLATAIVALPVGLSTAWLGAANWVFVSQADFAPLAVRVFFSSQIGPFLGVVMLLYPCERWFIRDRALNSKRWIVLRFIAYLALAIPMGWLSLWGIRWGVEKFPELIESSNFVIIIANIGIVALLYTFIEQVIAEIGRREAQLKNQIVAMQIEIDEARRSQQVKEIAETDYFKMLEAKAKQMRGR